MSHALTSDEISKLCQALVYQVAYAFYDAPYIIILKLLVQDNVMTEGDLAHKIGLTNPEVRKYMGTLHLHRLVRRHVNKEKVAMSEWRLKQQARQLGGVGAGAGGQPTSSSGGNNKSGAGPGAVDANGKPIQVETTRTKDVYYWILDYREFANVVKYRLAIMRKGIDEKIRQEVGHRGYICPLDGRTYDPLDLSHLFDPFSNSFKCEDCSTELIEHDPSLDLTNNTSSQDMMQRFNIATAPIRDALKAVEGLTLPSVNIVAWIAQNVKTSVVGVDGAEGGEGKKKFEVVIGAEEDDEKEKLAKAQREQNALPQWYTHSTVTGQATTLGLDYQRRLAAAEERGRKITGNGGENADEVLALHYENLEEEEDDEVEEVGVENGNDIVKVETTRAPVVVDDDDEEGDDDDDDMEDVGASQGEQNGGANGSQSTGKYVTVNGQSKRVEDVTDEDQEAMTTEEYEAYAEAMYG
ncbi:hypothetical protein CI109_102501 [Kwoniella shandongensis]|uniref:Uncharacterized protein n=1 Tax=Kwoniella shandongensis TaxID=1734106 RepID=A0A5M6BZV1_9TREE|nr:uncharacterized protein CI109_003181 [Kwoniella shandongensis]KAA5528283.1 hypothetical protein CI109_003181 [Kwoniella shandongensis]